MSQLEEHTIANNYTASCDKIEYWEKKNKAADMELQYWKNKLSGGIYWTSFGFPASGKNVFSKIKDESNSVIRFAVVYVTERRDNEKTVHEWWYSDSDKPVLGDVVEWLDPEPMCGEK